MINEWDIYGMTGKFWQPQPFQRSQDLLGLEPYTEQNYLRSNTAKECCQLRESKRIWVADQKQWPQTILGA
jgi:hypothetical protein